MSSEFVSLGDTVYFDLFTHNVSGALVNADATPRYFVYKNGTETITQMDNMTQKTNLPGCYKGYIVAAAASGYSAGDFCDIQGSGLINGTVDRISLKSFVINDVYDSNLTSISGIAVANSHYVEDSVWNAIITQHNTNNTFGSGFAALNQTVYFADIKFINDVLNADNEYAAIWYKNNQPVPSSQLTDPAISVFNTSTGSALISNQKMSFASTQLGSVRFNTGTVVASGEPYLVIVSGVIDSISPIGRKFVV